MPLLRLQNNLLIEIHPLRLNLYPLSYIKIGSPLSSQSGINEDMCLLKIARLHCFLSICMLYDMTSLIIFWLPPFSWLRRSNVSDRYYIGIDVLYFWPLFNLNLYLATHTNTTTISGLYTILSLLTSNFVLLYTTCRLNIIYIFFIFSFFFWHNYYFLFNI